MNVLHLFSNHKWTGPAEPALMLCAALRDLGVRTEFACSAGPDLARNRIVEEARNNGIEPILDMRLSKHRHPIWNWRDARTLRRLLAEHEFDLVHTHLDNDHAIALAALGGDAPDRLVRSSYYGGGFPVQSRYRRLLKGTAFLFEPSQLALDSDMRSLELDRNRGEVLPGAIDLARFDPSRDLPDMRDRLGIPADAFVVGIVARMQTHRRFEYLVDAAQRLMRGSERVHLLVVGRGTKQEQVIYEPVRRRGLMDRVHFTGYLQGDEYVAALNAFDVKVFLVPGSDGTCRAVREAMAMGKPVVAARRGMLAELVEDGVTGQVVEDGAESLARCLAQLEREPERVKRFADNARAKALREFDPAKQAERVAGIYERLLDGA